MTTASRPPATALCGARVRATCYTTPRGTTCLLVCVDCVGLGDLEFLPAGDARLSRRARVKSARCAVVVRFSRTRRRYERQGLLVEPSALADARGVSSIDQFHLTDRVE
jgi:hypothetical protein